MSKQLEKTGKPIWEVSFESESDTLINLSKELMCIQGDKFILKDEEQREIAAILLKDAHSLEKKIKEHYKPIEDAHKETEEKIKAAKESQLKGPLEAKNILSQGIGEFEAMKIREAEKQARIEKEKIEQERLKEAARKIEEAKKLKEAGTPESMTEAINLETEAEDLLDAPVQVNMKKPEKLKGIRQLRTIKCEIINESALKQYLLTSMLDDFLMIDEKAIRAYVKQKGGNASMPGLRIWEEFKASSTGR